MDPAPHLSSVGSDHEEKIRVPWEVLYKVQVLLHRREADKTIRTVSAWTFLTNWFIEVLNAHVKTVSFVSAAKTAGDAFRVHGLLMDGDDAVEQHTATFHGLPVGETNHTIYHNLSLEDLLCLFAAHLVSVYTHNPGPSPIVALATGASLGAKNPYLFGFVVLAAPHAEIKLATKAWRDPEYGLVEYHGLEAIVHELLTMRREYGSAVRPGTGSEKALRYALAKWPMGLHKRDQGLLLEVCYELKIMKRSV